MLKVCVNVIGGYNNGKKRTYLGRTAGQEKEMESLLG